MIPLRIAAVDAAADRTVDNPAVVARDPHLDRSPHRKPTDDR